MLNMGDVGVFAVRCHGGGKEVLCELGDSATAHDGLWYPVYGKNNMYLLYYSGIVSILYSLYMEKHFSIFIERADELENLATFI